jgi:peptide/nickel transport system substrate-binding protein
MKVAEILERQWSEVGVKLVLDTQDYERISSETIPRRDYDMLLFEIEASPDPDKYNLWHSTQSEYPNLNLSGYAYERVDIYLEEGRKDIKTEVRKKAYAQFQKYIMADMPAIYLYHPTYTFIAHDSVKGIELNGLLLPQDRYHYISNWYIEESY